MNIQLLSAEGSCTGLGKSIGQCEPFLRKNRTSFGFFATGLLKALHQRLAGKEVRRERRIHLASVVENLGHAAAVTFAGHLHWNLHSVFLEVVGVDADVL